jgi:hypothetical protein
LVFENEIATKVVAKRKLKTKLPQYSDKLSTKEMWLREPQPPVMRIVFRSGLIISFAPFTCGSGHNL